MANYTCPSCGALFNGKKCRQCAYEHFIEETAHDTHIHRGRPPVINAPSQKPIPRKNSSGRERRTRKSHPLAGFLVILAVIHVLMPLLRNWGLDLEKMEVSHMAAEPLPEDLVILHKEGPITILAREQEIVEFAHSGFTLWVKNGGSTDVTVSARHLTANGVLMEHGSLSCESAGGSIGKGWLYLDMEELDSAGIEDLREVRFVLEVMDEEGTVLFDTDIICLGD